MIDLLGLLPLPLPLTGALLLVALVTRPVAAARAARAAWTVLGAAAWALWVAGRAAIRHPLHAAAAAVVALLAWLVAPLTGGLPAHALYWVLGATGLAICASAIVYGIVDDRRYERALADGTANPAAPAADPAGLVTRWWEDAL